MTFEIFQDPNITYHGKVRFKQTGIVQFIVMNVLTDIYSCNVLTDINVFNVITDINTQALYNLFHPETDG